MTMSESDEVLRTETLARLAQSRAEIRRVLEPPLHEHQAEVGAERSASFGQFPRSRTMRLLMSGRGLGTVGALVGGLLVARPALALRLLRLLPSSAVARMLLVRAVAALRAKHP
jgi:hypothetical protein